MTSTADTAHHVAQDQNDRALRLATFARNTPLMRAIERIDTGSAAETAEALRHLKSAAANVASGTDPDFGRLFDHVLRFKKRGRVVQAPVMMISSPYIASTTENRALVITGSGSR